jgi:TonB family protein
MLGKQLALYSPLESRITRQKDSSIMNKSALMKSVALLVFSVACVFAQSQASSPNSASTDSAVRRVQVDTDAASALLVHKAPINYPDAARNAGIQGTVVMKVVTTSSGEVKEVTVVSGDPALAQAAAESVKQWKYKPYQVEGSPAEIETQVSISFHLKARTQPLAAPLGLFRDNAYSNDYFGIYFPLPRDWVRATQLMRGKLTSEGKAQNTFVLLAAVHIPQDTDPLKADSSFTIVALSGASAPATDECKSYLALEANDLHSRKEGEQKGDVIRFSTAGHDFYRGDFEYRDGQDRGALLCTSVKDYMLLWNIRGGSKQAVETAVSTLNSMTPAPPAPRQPPDAPTEPSKDPKRARVAQGVSQGLLIKRVQPVYPAEARYAHIQGTVRLSATINKNGDIVDLEVLDGPIELVVSAVNAVRKWKYRPYLLMGNPVEVQTEIMVNYTLSGL